MDRVNARSSLGNQFGSFARHNQNMLIVRRMALDERYLLVHIAFHAAAQRGIKLREIANLHRLIVAVALGATQCGQQLLLCVRMAQVALGFNRRGAARSRGRDRLFVNSIRHIASDEHSGVFARDQVLRD